MSGGDPWMGEEEIRDDYIQPALEAIWGTAWGEAEAEACDRIMALVMDPESTQR